jgi:hypothetical protein
MHSREACCCSTWALTSAQVGVFYRLLNQSCTLHPLVLLLSSVSIGCAQHMFVYKRQDHCQSPAQYKE